MQASGLQAQVDVMVSHDDGNGAAIYIGGTFLTAGGVVVANVARWNGSSWAAMAGGRPGGASSRVSAMCSFDDGSGSALYVGGAFFGNIAKWDGTRWWPLGDGAEGDFIGDGVESLSTFDDGTGTDLYVGGDFDMLWDLPAGAIAIWDGCDILCPEDLDGSGDVGFGDLLTVLSNWGACPGCPADLDGDNIIGFSDLLAILSAWGPC